MSVERVSRRRDAALSFVRATAAAALALGAACAPAATFVVNTLADAPLGATDCSGSNPCNLRDAIDLANRGAGLDSVAFQAGLNGTIALSAGEIAISSGLGINGPGAARLAIDGQGQRIFAIALPAGSDPALNPVTIAGLTFTGGTTRDNGGAIVIGDASVTFTDCSFSNNRAGYGSGASGSGGAVYASPGAGVSTSLSLQRVRFDNNNASYDGGAVAAVGLASVQWQDTVMENNNRSVHAGGGAYLQAQTIAISGGRVSGSTCGRVGPPPTPCALGGGGLALQGRQASATLTLTNLRVEDNTGISTGSVGGGLMLYQFASATLDRVQLSGNSSGDAGGGLQAHNVTLTLRNSTLANNHAYGGNGGGFALASAGSASLDNTTVTGNDASGIGGGAAIGAGTSAAVRNSILAFNTANGLDDDAAGSFSLNYSLLRAPAGSSAGGTGNLATGLDPQLGTLGMNNDSSLTRLPAATSPVLNMGDPATAAGSDQRGLPRVAGGRVDLGAAERQSPEDIIFRSGLD